MKILFVSFQENSDVIGVKYLDAFVAAHGHESSILLIPKDAPVDIAAALEYVVEQTPDIIGLSAMSYEFARARDFAVQLRERLPGKPLLFGGIHATAAPEDCLAVTDIVVRGEGEETVLALLEVFAADAEPDLEQIAGIAYHRDGAVRYTPVRQPVDDLDALPSIRHLPESLHVVHRGRIGPLTEPAMARRYARYQATFLSVVSSRGCPFSCRYCCNSALKRLYGGQRVRPRNVRLVIDEIVREVAANPNILYVNFQDDCFMMHTVEWLTEFARRYGEEVGIPFIARTTPRHITPEKLKILKSAGLRWVFMGMQTGSDQINREIYGRHVTAEQFLTAARAVSDLNLCAWYDVILDNPYEGEEDQLKTIALLLRTPRPFQLDLFSLDYFPGTELYEQVRRDRIPVPQLGEKSYTEPEPLMINRYIRMSATLPRAMVRALVARRHSSIGRMFGMVGYFACLLSEPFVYTWLIFKSRDGRLLPTLRVMRAFTGTAISKLFLRKQG